MGNRTDNTKSRTWKIDEEVIYKMQSCGMKKRSIVENAFSLLENEEVYKKIMEELVLIPLYRAKDTSVTRKKFSCDVRLEISDMIDSVRQRERVNLSALVEKTIGTYLDNIMSFENDMKQMSLMKYRVWHEKEGKIFDVIGIEWISLSSNKYNLKVATEQGESFWIKECVFPIMQYTEFMDNNGVEVCEGDIVLASEYNATSKQKLICRREKYSRSLKLTDDWWESYDLTDLQSIEVIGNVYENPTLLEE